MERFLHTQFSYSLQAFLPLSHKDVRGRAEFSLVQTSLTVKSGEKTIVGISDLEIISGKVIR